MNSQMYCISYWKRGFFSSQLCWSVCYSRLIFLLVIVIHSSISSSYYQRLWHHPSRPEKKAARFRLLLSTSWQRRKEPPQFQTNFRGKDWNLKHFNQQQIDELDGVESQFTGCHMSCFFNKTLKSLGEYILITKYLKRSNSLKHLHPRVQDLY